MTRSDLQELAHLRLQEAQILLSAGSASGAYYIAGYAVECALKACIAKRTQQFEFPDLGRVKDSWVHDLKKLARVAGLKQEVDRLAEQNVRFGTNWNIVITWSEESRYRTWQRSQAESFILAITDDVDGVMQWLTTHW